MAADTAASRPGDDYTTAKTVLTYAENSLRGRVPSTHMADVRALIEDMVWSRAWIDGGEVTVLDTIHFLTALYTKAHFDFESVVNTSKVLTMAAFVNLWRAVQLSYFYKDVAPLMDEWIKFMVILVKYEVIPIAMYDIRYCPECLFDLNTELDTVVAEIDLVSCNHVTRAVADAADDSAGPDLRHRLEVNNVQEKAEMISKPSELPTLDVVLSGACTKDNYFQLNMMYNTEAGPEPADFVSTLDSVRRKQERLRLEHLLHKNLLEYNKCVEAFLNFKARRQPTKYILDVTLAYVAAEKCRTKFLNKPTSTPEPVTEYQIATMRRHLTMTLLGGQLPKSFTGDVCKYVLCPVRSYGQKYRVSPRITFFRHLIGLGISTAKANWLYRNINECNLCNAVGLTYAESVAAGFMKSVLVNVDSDAHKEFILSLHKLCWLIGNVLTFSILKNKVVKLVRPDRHKDNLPLNSVCIYPRFRISLTCCDKNGRRKHFLFQNPDEIYRCFITYNRFQE